MTLCLNPACSTRNAPNAQFCIKCGQKLMPLVCLNQGCINVLHASNAEFCMKCGGKLEPVYHQPLHQPLSYRQLEALLAAGKWREADQETALIMQRIANRSDEGWLNKPTVNNFPYEDLRFIDGLWVKYSSGRFGLSVQKRIYQSLGGTREYNEQVWLNFVDSVGWRKGGSWLRYEDMIFNNKSPDGYLPVARWRKGDLERVSGVDWQKTSLGKGSIPWGMCWTYLLSRPDL